MKRRKNSFLEELRMIFHIYPEEERDFFIEKEMQGTFRTIIEAVGTVFEEAEKKQITISMESQHDQIVPHNREWTAKVLVQLLYNAMEATPENGSILLDMIQEKDFLGIRVTDNGQGICAKDLVKIWKRHYRVHNEPKQTDKTEHKNQQIKTLFFHLFDKEEHEKKHSGMGLYLAQIIMEKQGGKLEASSVPGEGSSFIIWLKKEDPDFLKDP